MPKFKDYKSQYLDPRWQKRRLQIMERDDFTCQECGDAEQTLNVHHRAYRKGADVWDYADDQLVTLCQPCHQATEGVLTEVKLYAGQLSVAEQEEVVGFALGLLAEREVHGDNWDKVPTVCFAGWSPSRVAGYLKALQHLFWLPHEALSICPARVWSLSTGHESLHKLALQVQDIRKSEGRATDYKPERTVDL